MKVTGQEEIVAYLGTLAPTDFCYTISYFTEYQLGWLKKAFQDFHASFVQQGVDDRLIFSAGVQSMASRTFAQITNTKLKYRELTMPVGLIILNDRIVQIGMTPEPFLVEEKDAGLVALYQQFFLTQWNLNDAENLVGEVLKGFGQVPIQSSGEEVDISQIQKVAESLAFSEDGWAYTPGSKAGRMDQAKLWSVPKTTAEFLRYFVMATGSTSILEIGTSAGYSGLHLAMGAAYTGGQIMTIERLAKKISISQKVFAEAEITSITQREGNALDILQQDSGTYDLVFMDADKENYTHYFDLILPRLKVGGFIIADNVLDYGHLMQPYLDKVLGDNPPGSLLDKRVRSKLLPLDNGLLITQKLSD